MGETAGLFLLQKPLAWHGHIPESLSTRPDRRDAESKFLARPVQSGLQNGEIAICCDLPFPRRFWAFSLACEFLHISMSRSQPGRCCRQIAMPSLDAGPRKATDLSSTQHRPDVRLYAQLGIVERLPVAPVPFEIGIQ